MKNNCFYVIRNLMLIILPILVISCGAGTTSNTTLPSGTYTGVITPGAYPNAESETITMTYVSESTVMIYDLTTTSPAVITGGTFASSMTTSPCFTGLLSFGLYGISCVAGSTIQFTGCSMNNNTTTGNVSFTGQLKVILSNGNTCYSGGSISMNNYNG